MEQILLYHITHIDNLPGILISGGLTAHGHLTENSYTDISHRHIQDRRAHLTVRCEPGGSLHDYVPFYFCNRPPMLYIHFQNRSQENLIYIVSSIESIKNAQHPFVFTDGHAVMKLSTFYNDLDNLGKIDWPLMEEKYWRETEDDTDRPRRRQAEFLVRDFLPITSFLGLATLNNKMKKRVDAILAEFKTELYVKVRKDWYY